MTEVERAWQGRRILQWQLTMWCNYRCQYCRQDHSRHSVLESSPWLDNDAGGRPPAKSHWADNASPERWLSALERCFGDKRLVITLTGGEPLLDRPNMTALLAGFAAAPWVESVRIDTNGSSKPYLWPVDWSKVSFMVSYHPTEISEVDFFADLDGMLSAGLDVTVVNLVVLPDRVPLLASLARKLRSRGVPLGALPAYGTKMYYTEAELQELRRYLPPEDWFFRSGGETYGRSCLYPALAYEMNPDGAVSVACHPLNGNVLEGTLPRGFDSYVDCPHEKCTCVNRYTFLGELGYNVEGTPLAGYAKRYMELQLC